jgi:hypothetical protein
MPEVAADVPGGAIIIGVAVVVILMMLILNAVFIKRLVSKIDLVSDQVTGGMQLLSQRVTDMENTIKDLSRDLKDIGIIKERTAVLEYALNEIKLRQFTSKN